MTSPDSLTHLSKKRLLKQLSEVVARDRGTTAKMLACIAEVDRRKLYAEQAYPSMFAFCVDRFHMSEAIAHKRIRAGRAASRFPRILEMIRVGELHLSGVHQLASHLTEANHEEVLAEAKHKSMREIDELVAKISPRPDGRSLVRAMPHPSSAASSGTEGTGRPPDVGTASTISDEHAESTGIENAVAPLEPWTASGTLPATNLRSLNVPLSPRRYRLHVTISQEARDDLEQLQNLLSHQIPSGDPALVVERALKLMLQETKKRKAALTKKPRRRRKGRSKKSRAIPAEVKRTVFTRDNGRCAFVDSSGRRCKSAWQLEFHHCIPYGRGGKHTVENIQLRCRAHNQYEAELDYGPELMRRRRASAKSA